MKNCRYCDKPLPIYRERVGVTFCPTCDVKREATHRFVVECAKFKRRIGYDEILKKRAEEGKQ